MTKDKKEAITNYTETLKESWTWNRLTEKEKNKFIELVTSIYGKTDRVIKGDFKTRWNILDTIYYSFLIGLGYEPLNWREPIEVSN